ncbi:MAG: hypothetical protein NVSMB32_08510 [Actinomycetota bacterium]
MRLDLIARTSGLSPAVGAAGTQLVAADLLATANRFLTAAREELAAMSVFASQAATWYRRADGALGRATPGAGQ